MAEKISTIDNLLPISPNFNFGLFSSSNSGKSVQAVTFICNFRQFYPNTKVGKVIVVASVYQKLYDKIKDVYDFEFLTSIDQHLLDTIDSSYDPNECTILFIDDMGLQLAKNDIFTKLVTIYSHHRNVCNIVTAHSIYLHSTPEWRTFIKNLHLIAIGNSATQRQSASTLFTQIFGPGGAKHCKMALQEAEHIQKQRYGNSFWFLYLNLSSTCDHLHRVICDPFSDIPLIFVIRD